jgi:hypothetical protein
MFSVMHIRFSAIYVTEFVLVKSSQFSVGDSHGKVVVEDEYKKSDREDLKTLCAL